MTDITKRDLILAAIAGSFASKYIYELSVGDEENKKKDDDDDETSIKEVAAFVIRFTDELIKQDSTKGE